MNKNRLEAFSDGVLAIIITIMVLEFKIPQGHEWEDLHSLIPVFISYGLSFAYIGIYWGNHHHLLHSVKRVTPGIMLSNLNLLFWLSLVPFATGWMGKNLFQSNTVMLYGTVLLVCAISYFLLMKLIENNAHEIVELKKAFKISRQKGIYTLIMNIISLPLAYFYPFLSISIYIIGALMWLIPDKNIQKALES